MKRALHILVLCLLSSVGLSQSQLLWQKTYGGSETDGANHIQQTDDGGFIVSGYSESSDGDLDNNDGIWDVWILKLDENGDVEWEKTFGGSNYETARVIKQTRDGGYIFIGWTRSSDGDISSHAGNNDIWVVKLSPSGEISWEQTYGEMYHEQGFYIQQTSDGGYILSGTTTDNGTFGAFVIKIDEFGNEEWQSVASGDALDTANTIIEVSSGGYIFVGNSRSSFDEAFNSGGMDCIVVKLSDTGETEWLKLYGGTNDDFGNSIDESSDGSFVIAGSTELLASDALSTPREEDVWVFKIDLEGNVIWEETYGSVEHKERAISIEAASNGTWILTGYTESINSSNDDLAGLNCYVLQITSNGTLLWDGRFGGGGDDSGNFVMETEDGSFIATGFTHSDDGDFDTNQGERDLFVMKILPNRSTSTNEIPVLNYALFPNPSSSYMELRPSLDGLHKYLILNQLGKQVASGEFEDSRVGIQDLEAGSYSLLIYKNNEQTILKFVKL